MTNTNPVILSIDTSCDETSAAVTDGLTVLSNVVWSQSKIHAKFGGVVPSETRRQHERKIFWVVDKAVNTANITYHKIDAFSVTVGPGLAIALGVGINYAKKLAEKYSKPLIAVNHLEGHLFSALAEKRKHETENNKPSFIPLSGTSGGQSNKRGVENIQDIISNFSDILHTTHYTLPGFPSFGIVVSGGNTLLVLIKKIGKYEVLAQTLDDALGESLDKSARLLGLGYPGGAVLEKFALLGDPHVFKLPIPMLGREHEGYYSYSGIKTAFSRLYNSLLLSNKVTKNTIYNLAASYQNVAFTHFFRVSEKTISAAIPIYNIQNTKYLFVGGGVAANVEFRKRVRVMCKKLGLTPLFPYSKKLYGDNAAMIGVVAYFKYLKKEFIKPDKIDRLPNFKIGEGLC